MATSLTSSGIVLPNNQTQTSIEGIVKIGIASSSQIDFYAGIGGGSWDYVTGTQIDMGVPQKANNWYRARWQTVCDDNGSVASGNGAALFRYTPSSGWTRMQDQGHHANLENDTADHYYMQRCEYLCSVHPSYPNEPHSFRIYCRSWNGSTRINCGISRDYLRNGWNNNIFEVFEIDVSVVNSGNLTRL